MQRYIDIEIKTSGNLRIALTELGREELNDIRSRNSTYAGIWEDLLEDYSVNGSYTLVRPEEIGALTEAPIIGLNVFSTGEHEEQNLRDFTEATLWWFPDYHVVDEFEVLMRVGYVYFMRVE